METKIDTIKDGTVTTPRGFHAGATAAELARLRRFREIWAQVWYDVGDTRRSTLVNPEWGIIVSISGRLPRSQSDTQRGICD